LKPKIITKDDFEKLGYTTTKMDSYLGNNVFTRLAATERAFTPDKKIKPFVITGKPELIEIKNPDLRKRVEARTSRPV